MCGDFVRGQVVTILISLRDILARYQDCMTWRPKSIIFNLFPKIGTADRAPFQAWMAVLLARPSLPGKSKHRSCQRALGATCPQESVASARVWREQKKLERAASMFVSQASWRCWSRVNSATTWQQPAVWEWILRSSGGCLLCKAGLNESTCVSLENFVRSPYKGLRRRRAGLTFFFFLNLFTLSHVMTRAPAGLT